MIARRLRLPGAPLLAQLQTIPLRTKLTYVDSPMGIVDSVMGDSVIVQCECRAVSRVTRHRRDAAPQLTVCVCSLCCSIVWGYTLLIGDISEWI